MIVPPFHIWKCSENNLVGWPLPGSDELMSVVLSQPSDQVEPPSALPAAASLVSSLGLAAVLKVALPLP